jgi:hypothetical protein
MKHGATQSVSRNLYQFAASVLLFTVLNCSRLQDSVRDMSGTCRIREPRVDFPDWSGPPLVRRAPQGIAGRERYDLGEIQATQREAR